MRNFSGNIKPLRVCTTLIYNHPLNDVYRHPFISPVTIQFQKNIPSIITKKIHPNIAPNRRKSNIWKCRVYIFTLIFFRKIARKTINYRKKFLCIWMQKFIFRLKNYMITFYLPSTFHFYLPPIFVILFCDMLILLLVGPLTNSGSLSSPFLLIISSSKAISYVSPSIFVVNELRFLVNRLS